MLLNKLVLGILTLATAWFAVIMQWQLASISITNFLSFFTIQNNLLVALCLSFSLLAPRTIAGKFFSKVGVQSAIALYIFIVALVANTMLRGLLVLSCMPWAVDKLLHVAVPVLYIIYWLVFTPRTFFAWKQLLYWLIYPLLYTLYSMLRGSIVHWYPYPFLNADKMGYPKVFVSMGIVLAAFALAGLAIIAIKRSAKKDNVISA